MSRVRLTTIRFVLGVFLALIALALPRASSGFTPIVGGSHAQSITVAQIPTLIDVPGLAGQEKQRVGSGDLVNAVPGSLLVPGGGTKARGTAKRTEEVVTRKARGADGATSQHRVERLDGNTNSVTHQVLKEGKVIHQHQTHVGTYGTRRQFPDEWVEFSQILGAGQ